MLNFAKILFKRYSIESFFLSFPQVVAIFVSLITLPIILANLPIKDYGQFQLILALQVWLSALTADRISSGAKKGIANGQYGTFLYAFFIRIKFLLIIVLISLIASFFVYNAGLGTLSILLIIMNGFLILGYLPQASYPEFFIAKKQFKSFAFWRIVAAILIPLASTIVAFLTHDILIFAIVQLGITAIISLTAFFYVVLKNNLFSAYKRGEIDKTCSPYGIKLIPAAIITASANKITNFIIGFFFGFAHLAIFSIASKLQDKFNSFSKTPYNLFYSDFARKEKGELIEKIKPRLKQGIAISFSITFIFFIVGYFYIHLFLPESYQLAKIYFSILSLGLPVLILQMILHTILEANLRYKELTVLIMFSNLIKIFLIVILGLLFGAIGACWAIVLGAWLSFYFYYILTIKKDSALILINKFPRLKKLSNF